MEVGRLRVVSQREEPTIPRLLGMGLWGGGSRGREILDREGEQKFMPNMVDSRHVWMSHG